MELPSLGSPAQRKPPASFTKIVLRGMTNAEMILKVRYHILFMYIVHVNILVHVYLNVYCSCTANIEYMSFVHVKCTCTLDIQYIKNTIRVHTVPEIVNVNREISK